MFAFGSFRLDTQLKNWGNWTCFVKVTRKIHAVSESYNYGLQIYNVITIYCCCFTIFFFIILHVRTRVYTHTRVRWLVVFTSKQLMPFSFIMADSYVPLEKSLLLNVEHTEKRN